MSTAWKRAGPASPRLAERCQATIPSEASSTTAAPARARWSTRSEMSMPKPWNWVAPLKETGTLIHW
jgi:hypothetical protein